MGRSQGEQPLLRKVGVGPALMVRSASPTLASVPVAQDAAQAHAHPTVQRGKGNLWLCLK